MVGFNELILDILLIKCFPYCCHGKPRYPGQYRAAVTSYHMVFLCLKNCSCVTFFLYAMRTMHYSYWNVACKQPMIFFGIFFVSDFFLKGTFRVSIPKIELLGSHHYRHRGSGVRARVERPGPTNQTNHLQNWFNHKVSANAPVVREDAVWKQIKL